MQHHNTVVEFFNYVDNFTITFYVVDYGNYQGSAAPTLLKQKKEDSQFLADSISYYMI